MNSETNWMCLCVSLLLGEAMGFYFSILSSACFFFAVVAGLFILFGYGFGFRHWPWGATALLGFALALGAVEKKKDLIVRFCEKPGGSPITARIEIGRKVMPTKKGGCRFDSEIDGLAVKAVMNRCDDDALPRPGEMWNCMGWVTRSKEKDFSSGNFWICEARRAPAPERCLKAFLSKGRRILSERIGVGLDHDERLANLNRAMLLGERELIKKDDKAVFVNAGTVHVFAISGLHVLLVAGIFLLLIRLCGISVRYAGIVILPALWFYVLLVGSGPSAVRAAIMASFHFSAPLFWRKPNAFASWSMAFVATYLSKPEMLFDIGCAFSFTVMMALISWNRLGGRLCGRWTNRIAFPTVAWAAGVPIAAHSFGRIAFGGLFANILVVPLAGVSVCCTFLGVAASFVSTTLSAHLNNLAALSTKAMVLVSMLVSEWNFSSVRVMPWGIGECIVWCVGMILLLFAIRSHIISRQNSIC